MRRILIYLLIFIALLIDAYGWPTQWIFLVPPISLLVVAFWAIYAPRLINIGTAFVTGIMMDIIYATAIGHHAFAYVIIIYILIRWHRRIRVYPLWQQTLMLTCLVLVERLIYYWIETALYFAPMNFYFLACVPVVLFIWPLVYWLNAKIQQTFYLY